MEVLSEALSGVLILKGEKSFLLFPYQYREQAMMKQFHFPLSPVLPDQVQRE